MKQLRSGRRRSRTRGRQRRVSLFVLIAAAAILGAVVLGPALASSQAFSTLAGGRNADVAVVEDPAAYLGVDSRETVPLRQQTELATLTNHLNERATVTLDLLDDTDGTLSAPGDTSTADDSIQVVLDPTSSVTVDINATHPGDVEYEAEGQTSVTTVTLVRSVSVTPPGEGGDGGDGDDDDGGDDKDGDDDDGGDDKDGDDDHEGDDDDGGEEDDPGEGENDDGTDDTGDQKAISFAAFCSADGSGSASEVTIVDVTENDEGEAVAIEWTAEVSLSTVVLKTGPTMENFAGGTSGSAESGAGTAAGDDQSPPHPCPGGESLVHKDESVGG